MKKKQIINNMITYDKKPRKPLKWIMFPIVCTLFLLMFTIDIVKPVNASSYTPTEFETFGNIAFGTSFKVKYASNDFVVSHSFPMELPLDFDGAIEQDGSIIYENTIQMSSTYGLSRSIDEIISSSLVEEIYIPNVKNHYDFIYDFNFNCDNVLNLQFINPDFQYYVSAGNFVPIFTFLNSNEQRIGLRRITFTGTYYTINEENGQPISHTIDYSIPNDDVPQSLNTDYFDLKLWTEHLKLLYSDNSTLSDTFLTYLNCEIELLNDFRSMKCYEVLYQKTTLNSYLLTWIRQNAYQVVEGDINFDNISYTDWLVNGVGSFINAEIFPNFTIGGILAVVVAFPLVVWFLKIVLGG